MRDDLQAVFERKVWTKGSEGATRSGGGSTLEMTQNLRQALPRLFQTLGVKSFLDAPCGDWFWMQHVDLNGIDYIGGDISSEVVQANAKRFSRPGLRFIHHDITSDPLPTVDLMLCRDCLMHLTDDLRWAFFRNFAGSDCRFLLTTVHHVAENNPLSESGQFRRFNPMCAPFNLPQALDMIPETRASLPKEVLTNQVAAPNQRSVGLWSRAQVAAAVAQHDAGLADPAGRKGDDA